MVFDKLFGWRKKREDDPVIPFGRYSDNNKSVEKVDKWTEAENLFKQKQYSASIAAFFKYLTDEEQENVILEKEEDKWHFRLYQGSKLVRGEVGKERLQAEVVLARMQEPSIPVMRRLLEMNFQLYYTRFTIREDKIVMKFDTGIETATPNKLYYGLKELATKADKQDDLLLSEFGVLEPVDTDHISQLGEEEKKIKYEFLGKWIRDTLEYIDTLDQEKFSGGISFLLLTLVFRIDYLISPEGKMLQELEKIASAYYQKNDKSVPERNPLMIEAFKEILEKTPEELSKHFFRSRYTFAIVVPHNPASVSEAIETALQNMVWYRDNNYPVIANRVMEYGFAFNQYSYSLPRPLTDLFRLFMQINYSNYFKAMGFKTVYYNEEGNSFDEDLIEEKTDIIINYWKQKYPSLSFKTKKLRFETLVSFNESFLKETAALNFG